MYKKNICIVNQYATTPKDGMGGRHYYISKSLVKQGFNVTIVSASFSHVKRRGIKTNSLFQVEYVDGIRYIWLKTIRYKGVHSKIRVVNWFMFALSILKVGNYLELTPNIVIYSSPSPIGSFTAKILAKKLNAKYIYEVRDIWPKTLVSLGNISSKNPIVKLMKWCEEYSYKHCSAACSNLENAYIHMESRGLDKKKFSWIPNGVDIDEFNSASKLKSPYSNIICRDKFTIGYTGSIGLANSVFYLVEAAGSLVNYPNIQIIIIGKGNQLNELKAKAKRERINNILFLAPIEKKYLYSTLSLFDVCFIGWNDNPIYEFGIAPNKIPEYMMAGKPIIHSYSGKCDPVSKARAGITTPAESSKDIKTAILELNSLSKTELNKIGTKGHKFAMEHYDYLKISKEYINFL